MKEEITIRKMKRSDLKRVLEIFGEGIEDGRSTFRTKTPSKRAWDKSHCEVCRLVAEKDGRVVGFAAISPYSARKEYSGVGETSIYFCREARYKGYGKKLMAALISESEAAGFWSLTSSVFSTNDASIGLHKDLGFREIGYRERLAQDRFGKWLNVTVFERRTK